MFQPSTGLEDPRAAPATPGAAQGADRRLPPGRSPALTEAACALRDGLITREQFWSEVAAHKPVRAYSAVPLPCEPGALILAIDQNKRHKAHQSATSVAHGQPVCIRLDIPAFTRHRAWVICVHATNGRSIGTVLSYDATVQLEDATFLVHEGAAFKVACGAAKSPMAAIAGRFTHRSADQVLTDARAALARPEWVQLGYDPERRSFFYERTTMRQVIKAARILQCGPLILARDPVFGSAAGCAY